ATPPVRPTINATPTATPRVPPTALTLRYFTAIARGEVIQLSWETSFELQVQAFQLWRSDTGNRGDAEQITASVIPSHGTAGSGATYSFDDRTATLGKSYTYWLVAINGDGSTENLASTIGALQQSLYLPQVRR
ncbi:MAG: hypothetical protein KDE31_30530, partial [Caldilineaceae bacterium]|nr:hypothetical protein [Caldilineaceae bacterium]